MEKEKYLIPGLNELQFGTNPIICASSQLESSLVDYDEYKFEW